VSAEIIFDNQPEGVYNLGDSVNVEVTIKAVSDISGNFKMILICQGKQTVYFQNGVSLKAGEEKKMETSLILNKENIGASIGDCKIKGYIEEEYVITNDFSISNLINVQVNLEDNNFKPGENIIFKGNAIKQTGEDVNGFIQLKFVSENDTSLERLSTVSNGFFSINISVPENMKAGNHVVELKVYELNSDEDETNKGTINQNLYIEQVPTNLEVIIEEKNLKPGETLRVKAILHDQTGEGIPSTAILTLKKSNNDIVRQVEVSSDESLEFEIPYNEPPSNWTVVAVSTQLDSSDNFVILEKKEVLVDFANGTVLLTNHGNVPYNGSVLIKIGENSSLNVDVFLDVDESKKYEIRAPDGEYYIEVISDGESKFGESVLLTGKAIDFKELGSSGRGLVKLVVWVFIIVILGLVAFLIYKKGYQKSFFGSKKKLKNSEFVSKDSVSKNSSNGLIEFSNRAILSLSINGDKHDSSVVCLKIKNLKDLKKDAVGDVFKRIVGSSDGKKAMIYEDNENIFFIFSALKTKTFRNEKDAIELSKKVEEILKNHNKLFKQKIDFGISINFGEIVGRMKGKNDLEFMAMKNLISNSKKLAELSSGEILLSRDFRDKAGGMIKTYEKEVNGNKVYTIREIRDREQHARFIANFLNTLERDKKEKERRESKN
jgi:hypothetical protein